MYYLYVVSKREPWFLEINGANTPCAHLQTVV
jgi:hypothetical protein